MQPVHGGLLYPGPGDCFVGQEEFLSCGDGFCDKGWDAALGTHLLGAPLGKNLSISPYLSTHSYVNGPK